MKYLLDSQMSREVDRYTIEQIGVPSMVLMERAALAVAQKTAEYAVALGGNVRIAALCGCGNNGADGVAAARILSWQGMPVDIIIAGDVSHATEEFTRQKDIAVRSGLSVSNDVRINEYDIIIDALLGTGLTRDIEGRLAQLVETVNGLHRTVISVDIPSGINASSGHVMGVAVNASATVTFGYNKLGMMLYPGKEYAGETVVADIGFCPEAIRSMNPAMYFTPEDIKRIPPRITTANKGTYGRILVVAGSVQMSGAAYMSGAAALRSGAGIVEIFTSENNAGVIRTLLPEAIVTGYTAEDGIDKLSKRLEYADVIIVGPGLSQSDIAKELVEYIISNADVPVIVDADGLNIISEDTSILKRSHSAVIITPHIGEMARLTGHNVAEIKSNILDMAVSFADEHNVICTVKDAVTVIAEPNGRRYVNNSGGPGMAKGGSGDILTGIIGGMLCLKLEPFSAAAMGVYVHGLAGVRACTGISAHSMLPTDMLMSVGMVMKNI